MEIIAGTSQSFADKRKREDTSSSEDDGVLDGFPEKRRREDSSLADTITSIRKQTWYYVLAPRESESDTDRAETIYSIQDKSTDLVKDTSDTSTKSSWSCDPFLEDVLFQGTCPDTNLNDDTSSCNLEEIRKSTLFSRFNTNFDGDLLTENSSVDSGDTDGQFTMLEFLTCIQCKEKNENSKFQYCEKCFKVRQNSFPPRPRRKGQRKAQKSHSFRKKGKPVPEGSSRPEAAAQEVAAPAASSVDNEDLCNTCFQYPRNGGYIHGKIIHVYNCYRCSIKILKQRGKCPICNTKVRQVGMIVED